MSTRTRRAAAAKHQRPGVVSDKEVDGSAAAGGILASLNVNIPGVKHLKGKAKDEVPTSVMISRTQRSSSHPGIERQKRHYSKTTAQSFAQDADDDLSAISCDVSPQRVLGSSNKQGDVTMRSDSASHDLTVSLKPSDDETSEDSSSSPSSQVAELSIVDSDKEFSFVLNEESSESECEASESILEESYDPEFDDDEYHPDEDDESNADEDLEFMEDETEESPSFTPRRPRRKDGERHTGYVVGNAGKAVPKGVIQDYPVKLGISSRTMESDDDSTVVEHTPGPKSRRPSRPKMSLEVQQAEIVDDDEISDNDMLVATIIDREKQAAILMSPSKQSRGIGMRTAEQEIDGMPRSCSDFQNYAAQEVDDSLLPKKDNILLNKGKKEHDTGSLEYCESSSYETKLSISNKPSLYQTPIQKKPKSRKKSFYRQEGRVKRGKWILGSKIGVGSFGVVHVGMNTLTGSLIAVKIFKVDGDAAMKDVRREIELMRLLKHQNIVQYLGAEMDKTNMRIFQEWVPGGSVASMLSRFGAFPLQVIQRYLSQTLSGLQYLHENNIIHRDIKGSNILVNDEGVVKLADFGASKKLSNLKGDMMMSLTVRGTPYFMAPEVFEERYSSKADIWGIGCVAYQMITASPPWKNQGFTNPISLFNHIKRSSGPPPLPHSTAANVSKEDQNLMNAFDMLMTTCFEKEPSTRLSAQDLLAHDFFDEIGSAMGDDDSLHPRLFSPDSQMQSPWSVKCKNSCDCVIPCIVQCKSEINGHANRSTSEIFSPKRDTSDWPEWAMDQFGKGEQTSPSKENALSNMMGSLALSEDSTCTQKNPFASTLESKSVLVGNTTFSNLLGLQLIDRKEGEN